MIGVGTLEINFLNLGHVAHIDPALLLTNRK